LPFSFATTAGEAAAVGCAAARTGGELPSRRGCCSSKRGSSSERGCDGRDSSKSRRDSTNLQEVP